MKKLNVKKIYNDAVKQLKEHQVEIEIALAALAVVAMVPDEPEVASAKEDVADSYEMLLDYIQSCIHSYELSLADLEAE